MPKRTLCLKSIHNQSAIEQAFCIYCAAVVKKLKNSGVPFYRPALPDQESEDAQPGLIYLMKQCWAEDSSERPSFDTVSKSLRVINKGKSVLFLLSCNILSPNVRLFVDRIIR